jgi:UPF0716 family protein affecting phage T7 exclusion
LYIILVTKSCKFSSPANASSLSPFVFPSIIAFVGVALAESIGVRQFVSFKINARTAIANHALLRLSGFPILIGPGLLTSTRNASMLLPIKSRP